MIRAKIIADKGLKNQIEKRLEGDLARFNEERFLICPSFCDVHVHFREPGFSYKETIETGCNSAARGGFTTVMTMPNLNPVPDTEENLNLQLSIIEKTAKINVLPYASITVGQKGEQLSDFSALSKAIAFSDDGRGVQSEALMEKAMLNAKALKKKIVAHCEDNSLLFGGYIHDGDYAKKHGHKGICSKSEYAPIIRDIELVKKTGVSYHVCHVSAKESVDAIRKAKAQGVDITCETAPHYLILTDKDLQEHGRFKMNPPIRGEEDKLALINGVIDGTIDMIATDHAPHSSEEKSRGLEKSAFGVVGLETSFASLYTHLVKKGIITLEHLVKIMSKTPRERFGVQDDGITVFDLEEKFTVSPEEFLSMGRATPFEGMEFYGVCYYTELGGKPVYEK